MPIIHSTGVTKLKSNALGWHIVTACSKHMNDMYVNYRYVSRQFMIQPYTGANASVINDISAFLTMKHN